MEKNPKVWCFLIKIPQVGHFVAKISTYALQEWNFGAFWPNLHLENIVKISRYIASNEISLKYRVYRKNQYRSGVFVSPCSHVHNWSVDHLVSKAHFWTASKCIMGFRGLKDPPIFFRSTKVDTIGCTIHTITQKCVTRCSLIVAGCLNVLGVKQSLCTIFSGTPWE